MSATFIIATIVVAVFLLVFLRMIFSATGRSGGRDDSSFPYDNNLTSIPSPSWTPDTGSSNVETNDAQCEVDGGGWSDASSDSGSCDSGSDGSSGGD